MWKLSFILSFSHPDVFQKNKLYLNSRILLWKAQLWETFWENKDYLCVNLPCIHEMKQEQSLFLLSSLKFWLTLFLSTTVVLTYTQIAWRLAWRLGQEIIVIQPFVPLPPVKIQLVSYKFSSCGCHLLLPLQAGLLVVHPSPGPSEKGKFYSGLKCCDVTCFSLAARAECDSTSKLFKLYFHRVSAICWPWYIWISGFGLNFMACFSETKMEKRFLDQSFYC